MRNEIQKMWQKYINPNTPDDLYMGIISDKVYEYYNNEFTKKGIKIDDFAFYEGNVGFCINNKWFKLHIYIWDSIVEVESRTGDLLIEFNNASINLPTVEEIIQRLKSNTSKM